MRKYISSAEAAEFLGVSVSTLATWRSGKNKRGPRFLPVGMTIRYDQADLEAWLESQKVDPNAKPEPVPVKPRPPKMADKLRDTLNLPKVPKGRTRKSAA